MAGLLLVVGDRNCSSWSRARSVSAEMHPGFPHLRA
jgi:hypothetical protein